MHRLTRLLLLAATAACTACGTPGAGQPPLPTVPRVDLARYAGSWYEIALLPNRFQKQCVADTQATYRLDGDRVAVLNRCRTADGRVEDIQGHAKVVPDSGNAKLRVSFFWPIYGDYWIVALDPDYRHVLVGTPDRGYAWVLSRTPQLDETVLNGLLDRAAALGFDRGAFRRTPQTRPLPAAS